MITIEKRSTGAFTPANDAEANGAIIGRCNALHDYLMAETEGYFMSGMRMVCIIMGFADVLAAADEYDKKEKAGATNTGSVEG